MDVQIPELLLTLVGIATICSVFTASIVQKMKSFSFIKNSIMVWILNTLVAGAFSIPFSMYFFKQDLVASIWVALFTFIGAPALYTALKTINPKTRTELQVTESIGKEV